MSMIIERNKMFLVKSRYGSFTFNNRQSAEQLNIILTDYENTTDQLTYAQEQSHDLEKKFDNIQKNIIQLQMTASILQEELRKLHEQLQ